METQCLTQRYLLIGGGGIPVFIPTAKNGYQYDKRVLLVTNEPGQPDHTEHQRQQRNRL